MRPDEGFPERGVPSLAEMNERRKIRELQEIVKKALGQADVPDRILSFIGKMEVKYPDLYIDTYRLYQVLTTRDPYLGHVTALDLPEGEIEAFIRGGFKA